MDKIGVLTPDETSKVINAYLLAREAPETVRVLKSRYQVPTDQDTEHAIVVTAPMVKAVLAIHQGHLGEIKKAVEALTNATKTDC